MMISLPEAALRIKRPHRIAYDLAFSGRLGRVERRNGRIFVEADAVARVAHELASRDGSASGVEG